MKIASILAIACLAAVAYCAKKVPCADDRYEIDRVTGRDADRIHALRGLPDLDGYLLLEGNRCKTWPASDDEEHTDTDMIITNSYNKRVRRVDVEISSPYRETWNWKKLGGSSFRTAVWLGVKPGESVHSHGLIAIDGDARARITKVYFGEE